MKPSLEVIGSGHLRYTTSSRQVFLCIYIYIKLTYCKNKFYRLYIIFLLIKKKLITL